jgi:carbamoyltransferase
VGAAYWAYNHILDQPRGPALQHAYLGSSYTDEEVAEFLNRNDIEHQYIEDDEEFFDYAAKALVDGKVCGWFRGRFEWGPRALGARSIIADPGRPDMKEIVNAKIKFREAFRPFAPSVIHDRAADFFDIEDPVRHFPYRFMLYVAPVHEHKKQHLGAITHVDGTARLQTVHEETNPAYYRMIQRFGQGSGYPVVLNTSFNLKGEPIVEDPSHAFNTFSLSGMDVLYLGNYLVQKEAKKALKRTKFALRHEGDTVVGLLS